MDRTEHFRKYLEESIAIGDVDPQNACLKYLCDRYELNHEQRFWMAFLFACTYSAPTAFYIYNEFPDFENVNVARLERWWKSNKQRCVFQTDRLRIKTQNLLVETFESYRNLVGGRTQACFFYDAAGFRGASSRAEMYDAAWNEAINIRNFGRFTMFIYLELVHELTPFKMSPSKLDVQNALSSRNGLCYALGMDSMIDAKLKRGEADMLERKFAKTLSEHRARIPALTAWSLETVLCAYKKHCRGKRWVGYYLDRQHKEIMKMANNVTTGVDWSVLWQYRAETYREHVLTEKTGRMSDLENPYGVAQ